MARREIAILPFAVLLGLGPASCGGEPSEVSTFATTVDTVGGIEHVRSVGDPPPAIFVERLTLGSVGLDGLPGDDEFGRITTVIADDEGNVYVADATSNDVRVFDDAGNLLRRIGRTGGGPGEVGRIQSIGWIGDTLAVLDPGNARLGLFTPEGEWLGQRPYMALTGAGHIRLYPAGSGELYMPFFGRVGERSALVFVQQTPAGPGDTITFDLRDPSEADSEGPRLREGRSLSVTCTHSGGQGISTYSSDLGPSSFVVPAPGGLRAAARGDTYSIAFVDRVGDTVRVVERDIASDPISDEEWAEEERKFEEFLDQFPDVSCDSRTLPRPERRGILTGIHFDDVGRMWVERETPEGPVLDVFASDGRLVWEAAGVPAYDGPPPYIRDDRLHVVVRDSLDVEYVKVLSFGM